jgi:hypothetical protein
VVTICTASLTFNNSTFCPHTVFMCFAWIWEQTAIISLCNINWLVFMTELEGVYCAVRSESSYKIDVNVSIESVSPMRCALHCALALLSSSYRHILWHTWRPAVRRVKLCGQWRMRLKASEVWRNASWLHQEGKLLNRTLYEQVVESFVPSGSQSTGCTRRRCWFC